MCVCVFLCVSECSYLQNQEEGTGISGAGITGGYELLSVGSEN